MDVIRGALGRQERVEVLKDGRKYSPRGKWRERLASSLSGLGDNGRAKRRRVVIRQMLEVEIEGVIGSGVVGTVIRHTKRPCLCH